MGKERNPGPCCKVLNILLTESSSPLPQGLACIYGMRPLDSRLRTLKDLNRRENVTLGGAPPVGSSLDGSYKATFSPDGRRLACVFFEKIIIWDIQ